MRLTQGDRVTIVQKVIDTIIEPRRAKHRKAEHRLADKVLTAALGKHKRAYLALPAEFQRRSNGLRVNCGGQSFWLKHEKDQPTACDTVVISRDLADEVRAHVAAGEQLKKDEDELRAQVRSVVASAPSDKHLRQLWPDGAKYYDKVLAGTPQLPVSVQALQKKIEECRA